MTERMINTDEVKVEGEPADLSAAIGSLTAMIRTECADIDKTRAIPATVTSALRDLGVFRLVAQKWTP